MISTVTKKLAEALVVSRMVKNYKIKSFRRSFDGTWIWTFSYRTQPYISYRVQTKNNNKKEAWLQLQKSWNL